MKTYLAVVSSLVLGVYIGRLQIKAKKVDV